MPDPNPMNPSRRRLLLWLSVALIAIVPSTFLFFSGRRQLAELATRTAAADTVTRALADSLDAARTQLLVDRVLVLARGGEMEQAGDLASRFFDRVDHRSRIVDAAPRDTEVRLRVLALRDQTISALTLEDPNALQLVEEIARLHLPLGDPALGARIPTSPEPDGLPMPGDTLDSAPRWN